MTIIDTFSDAKVEATHGENVYDKLVTAVTEYFNPQANSEFQKFTFRKLKQNGTIDEFLNELQQHAKTCNFQNQNSEIKSQLITGCTNVKVRQKGLSSPDTTLDQLLEYARTLEITETQVKEFDVAECTNFVKPSQGRRQGQKGRKQNFKKSEHFGNESKGEKQTCRNCGGEYPHPGGWKRCPARGKRCNKCSRFNHYSSVCLAGNVRNLDHSISSTEDESEEDGAAVRSIREKGGEYAFTVSSQHHASTPRFKVKMNNHEIEILADSGSTVNIISEKQAKKICNKKLKPYEKNVYGHNDSKIDVLGKFKANISTAEKEVTAEVLVVRKGCSLLSWRTCQDLNLITVCNNTSEANKIFDEFPQLFTGVGKLKDFKVHLHIDKNVKPVAQKYRRIPFHIRKDVEEQLMKDEASGIIEVTEGPTDWVSPIVCVPKQDPNAL